jgi:hypothetical protein
VSGLQTPTGGTVLIGGIDSRRHKEAMARVGWVFRNNQEFYKVSLFYLMDVYREMKIQIDTISGFTGTPRVRSSLDEEVESIRRELEGNESRRPRPIMDSSRFCLRNRRKLAVLCISHYRRIINGMYWQ